MTVKKMYLMKSKADDRETHTAYK